MTKETARTAGDFEYSVVDCRRSLETKGDYTRLLGHWGLEILLGELLKTCRDKEDYL